ncbi:hypothetical protein [Coleofasciculus chthonoplastes]|uniref:hypothetical protein n=1 Tax=Coleofasciculus chthonoplastes TaxID=64178 RepID=UPI0032FACE45
MLDLTSDPVNCDRPILSVRLQDETQHSSLLLHLKQECDRSIESCLVPCYLLIHKQGLDSLNPTYSEGRSHSFQYSALAYSAKAPPPVSGKAASER